MVGAVPRRGLARPQVDREGLAGAVLAVVDERAHRGEPEAALVGRLGALLVRVRGHQRWRRCPRSPDHRRGGRACRPTAGAGPTPRPAPGRGPPGSPAPPPRHQRPARRTAATPSDQRRPARTPPAGPGPPPHRPGSHRPARPRSPHRAAPSPDREPPAPAATAPAPSTATVQPRDPDRLPAATAHPTTRSATRGRNREPDRDRATLHLRSAFPLGFLRLSQSQVSLAGQALPCFQARVAELPHEIPQAKVYLVMRLVAGG